MFGSGLAENVLVWRTEEGDVRKSGLGNYLYIERVYSKGMAKKPQRDLEEVTDSQSNDLNRNYS